MIPFQTTKAQLAKLEFILEKLKIEKFELEFISDCKRLATNDQGVFDLLNLWFEEFNIDEKNEIINDLKAIINEMLYDW